MHLIYYSWLKSPVLTHGFASYYTSARMLTDGSDMTRAYDTTYYFSKMQGYGFGRVKDPSNLPTGSFMLLPLAGFEPVTAKIIWNILGIIFLFASIYILFKAFDIPLYSIPGLLLILVTLLFYPFYYNTAFGQAYSLLLLLASISVYGLKKDSKWLTAIILLTLPLFGISAWQMYYDKFYSVVAYSVHSSNAAYQTIGSLLGHLFSYESVNNPNALMNIPKIYVYYFTQISGLAVLFLYFKKLNNEKSLLFYVSSFSLNVIFSPAAEDYHSLFYLPLIFLTGSILLKNVNIRSPYIYLYAASVLLLMLPLPFRQLQDSSFPLYVMAYPRLYGALILTFIILIYAQQKLPYFVKEGKS